MASFAKKILWLTLGWAFIFLGIIGLFLPFLQGILFIFIGFLILSKESTIARSILNQVKERYPEQYESMSTLGKRFLDYVQRWNPK